MNKLLPVILITVVLSLLSHHTSQYDPLHCRYTHRERRWFLLLAVVLVLFAGLRTNYNDTYNYMAIYRAMDPEQRILEGIDWLPGKNPFFLLTNRILLQLGFSDQSFLLFYSVITVGIYLWFVRKYSCDLPLSMFLLVTVAGYLFTMAAIKQCMAMALCLVATDRALRKKYIAFVLWILLGMLYHPYALMYLVVPFLTFRPWSIMTVVMLALFAAAGTVIEGLIGTMVDVTDLLGENYDAAAFIGEGVNPFRVAVAAVPIPLAFVTRTELARKGNPAQNLMVNLSMLNAEIMFVGLFGTANYFARLANYFLPLQALAIPWLLTQFETKSRRLMTWAAVGGYSLFCIYSNAILGDFNAEYCSISLWEYLKSLF